ncbi:hypothetical protein K2F43_08385 [Clostridium estertheticum]|uniref:hypothetical protein n=1 Tax=Clostridium estertheticum TaxID=238834 RepID=UPI001C6E45E0|nr:hypothetical protein [Clostridium estertheticum]MBW9171222.1 hypothetical protein [Clostridium estertheticum]WLC73921.1 hypothetical protein KTC99_14155 [Clostridium estertheticum]
MGLIENKFNEDMKNIYFTAKRDIGYTATRFMQLISEKGGLHAAKQLIAKEGGTYGFEVLWENKRLDLSVEALVLMPEHESLFSGNEKQICHERLKQFGYIIGEQ